VIMNYEQLASFEPALARFLEKIRHCFKRDKTFEYLQKYMLGLMADLKRKSIEPIALASGVAVRTLQEFLAFFSWDHELADKTLVHQVGITNLLTKLLYTKLLTVSTESVQLVSWMPQHMSSRVNKHQVFSVNGAAKLANVITALLVSICFIQTTMRKIHSVVSLPVTFICPNAGMKIVIAVIGLEFLTR